MSEKPSIFVVGHPKCGTTALAAFLHQHPELFMCSPKEPRYFCPSWWGPAPFTFRSDSEYLALFAAAEGRICGEATSVYLFSTEAAELIHAFNPEAKIIMAFREPASFLRSYHLQLLKNPGSPETIPDLRTAIEMEDLRAEGKAIPPGCNIPEMLHYTDWLRYEEHYDRFANLFPNEQLLTITHEEFRADNSAIIRQIFDFLRVDPDFEPELAEHNTGGLQPRSPRLRRLVRDATHGNGVFGPVKRIVPGGLRPRLGRLARAAAFRPAPALDDSFAPRIREIASPHVEALGCRIGRDLADEWGFPARAGSAR